MRNDKETRDKIKKLLARDMQKMLACGSEQFEVTDLSTSEDREACQVVMQVTLRAGFFPTAEAREDFVRRCQEAGGEIEE